MPLNLESNIVPDSDEKALARCGMSPWMADAFREGAMWEAGFAQELERQEEIKRARRRREQSDFDLMEFKMRHKLR